MNDVLRFLQQRNSAARLTTPAPGAAELQQIFTAAMRAPDHARLRPWRFLTIAGERRDALGALFREALLARNPGADDSALQKAANAPLRAPLLVAVVVCLREHPKVPYIEQQLSAGCAAHGLLLAAEALGYAGIWRTGDACFDRHVMTGLGLAANEELVGFVYLGSRECERKPLPAMRPDDFVSSW
ncbi:nitroreductase [Seongchinamella sediminis]|uniref:Putative NAD(P)H nitroreductase n=1 Tax=Seongchinamella sediminis TaxID=2283635 RepID=A0A3L7DXU0_9GAMM|nr:nitroreductase [Seongchinamella sediminis]RLQ21535.1 nitroreductase [Seongchinamella sediminis]